MKGVGRVSKTPSRCCRGSRAVNPLLLWPENKVSVSPHPLPPSSALLPKVLPRPHCTHTHTPALEWRSRKGKAAEA